MKKRRQSDADIKRDVAAYLGGEVALYWPGGAGGGGSRKRLKGSAPVVRPHARTSASCRWCGQFHTTVEHEREAGANPQAAALHEAKSSRSRPPSKATRGAKVTAAPRQSPRPSPPARSSLAIIRDAVKQVKGPGRFGDRKVFVSALWRRVGRKLGLSLDEFKRWLASQHRAGKLQLARADLVAAMDPEVVASSQMHDRGAEFHFVVDPEAKEPW